MVVGSNPASIELFHRFSYSKIGFVSAHLEQELKMGENLFYTVRTGSYKHSPGKPPCLRLRLKIFFDWKFKQHQWAKASMNYRFETCSSSQLQLLAFFSGKFSDPIIKFPIGKLSWQWKMNPVPSKYYDFQFLNGIEHVLKCLNLPIKSNSCVLKAWLKENL